MRLRLVPTAMCVFFLWIAPAKTLHAQQVAVGEPRGEEAAVVTCEEEEGIEEESPDDVEPGFVLTAGFGVGTLQRSGQSERLVESLQLGVFAEVTDWLAVGMRLQLAGYDEPGVPVAVTLGLPSLRTRGRIRLGAGVSLVSGIHTEGLLRFGRASGGEIDFGLAVGAYVSVEIGDHDGVQLDYTLDLFRESAGFTLSGLFTLSYTHRF